MQLCNRATIRTTALRPAGVRRTPVVRVSAWAGDNKGLFSGLLRIFTPAAYIDSKEEGMGSSTGFKGKVDRKRKPFKDGYVAKKTGKAVEAEEEQEAGVMGYVGDAAVRAIAKNFRGDQTEPDWKKSGNLGWSKDVKSGHKKSEGFHSGKH